MNPLRAVHGSIRPVLLVAVIVWAVGLAQNGATSKSKESESFGGGYDTLLPAQQRLVDTYFQRARRGSVRRASSLNTWVFPSD